MMHLTFHEVASEFNYVFLFFFIFFIDVIFTIYIILWVLI
jgi:hypothetical protein